MQVDMQFSLPEQVNPAWKIGIVHSTYYKEEIDGLTESAIEVLTNAGIPRENISLHPAPGSFEVPLIGRALTHVKAVDALIGFGIVVQGKTKHADLLAQATTQGIMDIQVHYGMPFAFEILYVDSIETARERCFGEQSKGKEAAYAVLHSLAEIQRIRTSHS